MCGCATTYFYNHGRSPRDCLLPDVLREKQCPNPDPSCRVPCCCFRMVQRRLEQGLYNRQCAHLSTPHGTPLSHDRRRADLNLRPPHSHQHISPPNNPPPDPPLPLQRRLHRQRHHRTRADARGRQAPHHTPPRDLPHRRHGRSLHRRVPSKKPTHHSHIPRLDQR